MWEKNKAFILSRSETLYGSDFYASLKYLEKEMLRIKMMRDPSFKVSETFDNYIPMKTPQ